MACWVYINSVCKESRLSKSVHEHVLQGLCSLQLQGMTLLTHEDDPSYLEVGWRILVSGLPTPVTMVRPSLHWESALA